MTGRELLLVLAGTAAFAGVGGVGAALVVRDQPADAGTDQALLDRLDQIDRSIRETNDTIAASGNEIAGLRTRMEAVEGGLHAPRRAARAGRPGRVDVSEHGSIATEDGTVEIGSDGISGGMQFGGMESLTPELRAEIQKKLAGAMEDMTERLGGGFEIPHLTTTSGSELMGALGDRLGSLGKSLELRRLPAEERWQRARDEVGLNDTQVNEIQTALADRDAAMKEALIVDREEKTETGHFSVHRMDREKAAEANAAYRKRVDDVLNDEQKKSWKSGGFDSAFGNSSGGTTTIISIGSTNEVVPATPFERR